MHYFFSFLLVSTTSLICTPVRAVGFRSMEFPSAFFFVNKRLTNHTIKTIEVLDEDLCELHCYQEDNCVSFNFKRYPKKGEVQICELNNSTHLDHDGEFKDDPSYLYKGAKNACGKEKRCKNNGICQSGFTDKGYRCVCREGFGGVHCEQASTSTIRVSALNPDSFSSIATSLTSSSVSSVVTTSISVSLPTVSSTSAPDGCKFDFEAGNHTWEKTGTAFDNQPTYGDNPKARNRETANQQGYWWIGGYENRPSESMTAGQIQGDAPQGTLTSPYFNITGGQISFLIGGGCDNKTVRAELIVGNKGVRNATGKCFETMTRMTWNVHAFVGQRARVKLVDFSSGGWGHINFDDLKGNISCL